MQAVTLEARSSPPGNSEEGSFFDVNRLRRQYNDYASAKDAEGREMVEARHYYHGDQWTKEEISVLRRRKQPVVTSNRIVRKIDAVVGLVERLKQDPKAYPRTPQHDEGAELATASIRAVLDGGDWNSKAIRIARSCAIDGIAGIEYDLAPGDEGDPNLEIHIVYGDGFFYDPRSLDEGFTDARYLGVAKWIDAEQVKDMFPDKAGEIDDLMSGGTDLTTIADTDREKNWINSNEKRVRLADHWYVANGKWCWAMYAGTVMLKQGISPFIDEKGKTFSRYRMFSASVDHDGDRYGFVRNLKSPQDEINHRRSKALSGLNRRRVVSEKGAVDDVEVARREWARDDGWVETNPGLEMKPDDSAKYNDFKGQLELLQEAKNEIENFGPNPALIGQGLEDSSGRAISLLQQAGIAELGPYLSALKSWKIRVYRDVLNIIQRHWTQERWLRVTDDQNIPQFFQINKLQFDEFGRPQIVNAIGSLDVDVIIDEAPDAVNMQADNMLVLQSLGPQFAQQFPDVAIELSPLTNSVKKPILDRIRQKMNAPPPPDPKVEATKAQLALKQQDQQFSQDMQLRQQQIDETEAAQESERKNAEAQQNMMLEQMQAMFDMNLERIKAASQQEIERIKAAAQIRAQREKHTQDMDIAADRAAYQKQMAKTQKASAA